MISLCLALSKPINMDLRRLRMMASLWIVQEPKKSSELLIYHFDRDWALIFSSYPQAQNPCTHWKWKPLGGSPALIQNPL